MKPTPDEIDDMVDAAVIAVVNSLPEKTRVEMSRKDTMGQFRTAVRQYLHPTIDWFVSA